ncbi:MAG: cytidine deaminase [Rubricella sp.]
MDDLEQAARAAQANAYAIYSDFHVGAALRTPSGIYAGCNVENVAYPEGTCAEAGAIAAMCASGEREVQEVLVIAASPKPVTPCGGCRQKLREFAGGDVKVHMLGRDGQRMTMTVAELLPGAFDQEHME